MNTARAWYWIALGIFALGLNGEYKSGNLPGMHRVVARAESVFCQVATRAEHSFAVARVLMERSAQEVASQDFSADGQFDEPILAEHQVDLARAQARLDRMRATLERAQAERVRVLQRSGAHLSTAAGRRIVVVCPETGQRIEVAMPDFSGVEAVVRDIPVGDSF